MKDEYKKAFNIMKDADTIAIVGHLRPDGDCIGCALTLAMILRDRGKKVDVFFDACDALPRQFYYLNGYSEVIIDKENVELEYDLLIAVDLSEFGRMGHFATLPKRCRQFICFDHHQSQGFETITLGIIDNTRSSTGELIYEFLHANNIKITQPIADALYTAVSTDTGCFLYPSTTPQAHRIAAELMEAGADIETINYVNFRAYDRRLLVGLRQVLKNLRLFHEGKIAVTVLSKRKYKGYVFDIEERHKFKQYVNDIKGVKVSAFITREEPGLYRVSVRSHEGYDVEKCAKAFGGGGHKYASGFTVRGSYRFIMRRIVEELEKCF